ncbi:MAG: nucleoside triphosphate pyrophosphohydrolase [Crocinitomicaceae bacterium]|nr:nucleoside triphosphate pyrophosphohydrolase [Crocinitomicaceae bacterium]
MEKKAEQFLRLVKIMDELRAQCPWDKKQTLESLRHLTIEETYELSDAILDNDFEELKGELGDLLLHIVFYSKIASEKNEFQLEDVIEKICDKLVERHPHIYGDVEVQDEEEVKANWEKIKLKSGRKSVLSGVPNSMPSLVKAYRIQEKVKGVGFEWKTSDDVWKKVEEEFQEFKDEVDQNSSKQEEEFGDLLFSLVNFARFNNINPEDALERTNKKFVKRFQLLEELIRKDSKDMSSMSLEEMDKYWDRAKLELRK